MPNPTFVAVGDVMLDAAAAVAPRPGERAHAAVRVRPGGSATVAVVTAARAGAAATLVGRVGRDLAGDLIERHVRQLGIRPRLARDADAPTGTVLYVGDAVVADRGANAALSPEDVPARIRADAVLVSGYALLHRDSEAAARAALDRARAEWVAVDPAAASLVDAYSPSRFFEATASANAVVANEAEAGALTGEQGEEAARALAKRYRLACVKLGTAGAVAVLDRELARERVPPVESEPAVGAGDAFAAALLVALAAGASLAAAVRAACEAGARRAAED